MTEEKTKKSVWAVLTSDEGRLDEGCFALLGAAASLAEGMGAELWAVAPGVDLDRDGAELIFRGADTVLSVDGARLGEYDLGRFSALLEAALRRGRPDTVLFRADSRGLELAPTLAARLGTGLTAESFSLKYDPKSSQVEYTTAAVGELLADIICPVLRPQMATVRVEGLSAAKRDTGRTGRVLALPAEDLPPRRTQILERIREERDTGGLSTAETVVVAGLGVGSRQGFERVCRFAQRIGAAVGASRAAVEAGWADEGCMIGQTGLSIAPKLCIELGVSGAVQHMAGLSGAGCIVAVNKNRNAPIFRRANYGIAADAEAFMDAFERETEGTSR